MPVYYFSKLVADINQAMLWLKDYLPVLQSYDYGKDESTASTMLRKNAAMQNDITAFSKTVKELGDRVQNMIGGNFCGESERNRAENLQVILLSLWKNTSVKGDDRFYAHSFKLPEQWRTYSQILRGGGKPISLVGRYHTFSLL